MSVDLQVLVSGAALNFHYLSNILLIAYPVGLKKIFGPSFEPSCFSLFMFFLF